MAKDADSKLYIGNLPTSTTEKQLEDFLISQSNGTYSRVTAPFTLKKGYAFFECVDQTTADILIDQINSQVLDGHVLKVEPASKLKPKAAEIKLLPRLTFTKCHEDTTCEEIQNLLTTWGGAVVSVQKIGETTFAATLCEDELIEGLILACSRMQLHGLKLHVEVSMEEHHGPIEQPANRAKIPRRGNKYFYRAANFPLRMLVPAEYIGAIIGRGGETIRSIIADTHARIDVFRSNEARNGPVEKVVTIIGESANNSSACRKILELLAKEASVEREHHNSGEIGLKILCADSLVGRVIGKNGANIKKLMHESSTRMHVSNQADYGRKFLAHGLENTDRIITIRGSIDGMCSAEGMISSKMKASYEMDLHTGRFENPLRRIVQPSDNIPQYGSRDPPFRMNPDAIAQSLFHSIRGQNTGLGRTGHLDQLSMPSKTYRYVDVRARMSPRHISWKRERSYLYVPSGCVGGLIGNKGETIRLMIQESGASLKIESTQSEFAIGIEGGADRRINIFGSLESHFKAQFLIFRKLIEDGGFKEDLKLTLELAVPTEIVGRLIGKNGTRVKDIQNISGASIKFLTDEASCDVETYAQIYGDYNALCTAQLKLRHAVSIIRMHGIHANPGQPYHEEHNFLDGEPEEKSSEKAPQNKKEGVDSEQ